MATSVTSAINLETGEEEHVRNAKDGQLHKCKFCPAHMLPVQGAIREWHYRLAPGHQHTHPICMQLEKHGRAYDVQQTDLEKLFAGLYRPDKEPTTPPPSPGPEPEPEPGPEDPGDDGGEETGGEEEPEINKVLPCRTLHHLWQAGIYNLLAYAKIGDAVRSDIFLWFKDFNFLKTTEPLGNRILAVRPVKPLSDANAILFDIFRRPRGEAYFEEKYFVLKMDNRKQFNQACNRLFDLKENAGGVTEPVPKRTIVVIAGDWSEIDHADYTTYEIDDGPHRFGAQIAHYYSRKQIYPIPTDPFKTK